MLKIPFIYADDCDDCKRMKTFLKIATMNSGFECEVIGYNSNTEKAIEIAIEYGVEDIPACIIGDKVFFGKNGFTYEAIFEAVKELGE